MRLGVSGVIIPHRVREVRPESVAELARAGFTGFATRFWDDPFTVSREDAKRVGAMFADAGIVMTQATGYWQPLIHDDEVTRS